MHKLSVNKRKLGRAGCNYSLLRLLWSCRSTPRETGVKKGGTRATQDIYNDIRSAFTADSNLCSKC